MPEDATAQYRRLLEKLASGGDVQRKKVEGGRFIRKFGNTPIWTARASVKHRLVFTQHGNTFELLAFAERGDKEFYRHE